MTEAAARWRGRVLIEKAGWDGANYGGFAGSSGIADVVEQGVRNAGWEPVPPELVTQSNPPSRFIIFAQASDGLDTPNGMPTLYVYSDEAASDGPEGGQPFALEYLEGDVCLVAVPREQGLRGLEADELALAVTQWLMPSDTRVDQLREQVEALCGELSRAFAWNNELRRLLRDARDDLGAVSAANSVLNLIIKDLNAQYDELVAHAAALQAKLDASVLNETATRKHASVVRVVAVALGTSLAGFFGQGLASQVWTPAERPACTQTFSQALGSAGKVVQQCTVIEGGASSEEPIPFDRGPGSADRGAQGR